MLSEGDLLVVSDRSRADGRYLIVASKGADFVVKTPKGLAKTGTQRIMLNDEGVERLEALEREHPGALVSGELVGADQLVTIELVGGTVKIRYRAIGLLAGDLREQYVTGSLTIKRIG